MSELVQILEKTVSGVPTDQTAALEFLKQAATNNFPEFLKQLSVVLASTETVHYVRQAAGLQLKNVLVAKEEETKSIFKERWIALPADVRQVVKENVIRALGTETTRPSIAAQCINAIAGIEFVYEQWLNSIDILMSNVTNPSSTEKLKESSLEALGYMCQDIISPAIEAKANPILTAIVHGMRKEEPSDHVRLAATNAMLNALELTKQNFENPDERNIIMQVICEATQAPHSQIRVTALQCLVKIMSLYYNFMEQYMLRALFPITVEAMKNETDEIALQGIEFWSNVCEEELNLAAEAEEAQEQGIAPQHVSRHYAKGALPHILPILTQTLTKQDEDDEDEWIPAKAAAVCITLLAQCTQDAIVEQILPFITQHFGNDNWHYREAAIMAFGSILEGPSALILHKLVEQAIMPLIGTLNDAHAAVRDTAVWAIGRICDTCADLVTRPETLQSLIPALFTALHQEPRVAFNVCWAISSLAKAAYQVAAEQGTDENGEPATYILSSVFQQMVDELIKTTDRTDANTANLRIAGYEALMELIKNSPQDCYAVVQQTTLIVLKKLEQLLNIEHSLVSASDKAQLRDLQSLLCATLQSVLRKMHREDVPAISDPIMAGLLQIMQRCVGKESGGVMEDALVAVTELITVMGVQFGKYMDQFKPFLLAGLINYEDPQVCLAAIGVLSDLCRAFEGQIFPLMDEFMAHLLKILENTTVKRTVKPHALGCFGDIAIALGANFARYLNTTMDWLVNAASAAQISNPDDIDQIEYVELLREHCIAGFTGIVNALRGQNELALLLPHVQNMVQLIDMVARSGSLSSESLQASACGLIGDLVTSVGQPILPIVETEPILQMLQKCRRSKHNKAKTLAQWTTREISRVKKQV
uniref:Importin N-terminal domain-containing protein n=1 Tax=Acrobeloides nanus TaxID=290746 RepID=A0A914D9W3_9BILA